MCNPEAFRGDLARLGIDLHFSHHADVGAHELIFDVGKAPAGDDLAPPVRLWPLAPVAQRCKPFKDFLAPRSCRYCSLSCSGSTPLAAASSSKKDSLAKVFCMRPGERIQEGLKGVDSRRWAVVFTLGMA